MTKSREHYQAGQLDESISAALEEVKSRPGDVTDRSFLCDLLCFAGDLERADKHLDMLATLNPDAMIGVALYRQLIRAETARREFFAAGRVPEFLELPTDVQKLHLEASIYLRNNQLEDAARLLADAEGRRPRLKGQCNGSDFDDFRDLDDLLASSFEVLTSNGKYYWIPMESVELIELRPPQFSRDLIWRPAHMIVRGGPDGEVYLPALYIDSHQHNEDAIRLGRATDWLGAEGETVRGLGQRTYLAGEQDVSILELQEIRFEPTGSA